MFTSVASDQLSLAFVLGSLLDFIVLFKKSTSKSACSECANSFQFSLLSEQLTPPVCLHSP